MFNKDDFKKQFSADVKHQMNLKGLSIRKLAKLVGISPAYLSKITNASELPSYQRYLQIGEILEMVHCTPEAYPIQSKSYTLSRINELENKIQSQSEALKVAVEALSDIYNQNKYGSEVNKIGNHIQLINRIFNISAKAKEALQKIKELTGEE